VKILQKEFKKSLVRSGSEERRKPAAVRRSVKLGFERDLTPTQMNAAYFDQVIERNTIFADRAERQRSSCGFSRGSRADWSKMNKCFKCV